MLTTTQSVLLEMYSQLSSKYDFELGSLIQPKSVFTGQSEFTYAIVSMILDTPILVGGIFVDMEIIIPVIITSKHYYFEKILVDRRFFEIV